MTLKISRPYFYLTFMAAVILVYLLPQTHSQLQMKDNRFILGVDFKGVFRPSMWAIFHGQSPYQGWAYNPPWLFLLLAPVAILSVPAGTAVMVVSGFASFGYVAYKLGAKPITIVILLLSPPVIYSATNGNIDGLAALGLVFPPQIGLFFVLLKPQTCIGAAVFWAVQAYKKGGVNSVFWLFYPVTLALMVSFVLFGLWPLQTINPLTHPWNMDIWPWGIPIGIGLLIYSLRNKNMAPAVAASPFLSPYVSVLSWAPALLGFVNRPVVTGLLVVIAWVLYALYGRLIELTRFLFG